MKGVMMMMMMIMRGEGGGGEGGGGFLFRRLSITRSWCGFCYLKGYQSKCIMMMYTHINRHTI